MKQSPYDKAVDILLSRQKGASQELMKRFKNTRPFRQEPMTKQEMMDEYMNMTPDMLQQRLQRDGRQSTNNYIAEMEKQKQVM